MEGFIDIMVKVLVFAMVGLFASIILMPFVSYYSSCKQAKVYNKINNTEFTCSDFFWASQQINSQTQTINLK